MSIIVPIGWAYTQDFQAAPPGGSQAFPKWLVEEVELGGSRVLLGRGVRRVEVESGSVTGVLLSAKPRRGIEEHLVRCRYVVATNDVLTLYKRMLPPGTLAPKRLSKMKSMEMYSSCVTLSIGLNCPAEDLGFGPEMVTLTRDDLLLEKQNCGEPEIASITVLAPSIRDSSLAPGGCGTLTIYIAAEIEYGDHWKTGADFERGAAYKEFKQAYADIIIRRVEEQFDIELCSHIEMLDIATPVTHWRYTGNHRGSLMGGRPTRANMRGRVANYRTPIKRLYLGGHWAEYGGGVPVASRAGANAALLVLKEAKRSEYRRLRDLLDNR
ncbi:MAG: phytoene dehydrogenase-like protein [Planctomycetota bacterium]|jgi:phytoene dehydrogenase-like protein